VGALRAVIAILEAAVPKGEENVAALRAVTPWQASGPEAALQEENGRLYRPTWPPRR
jgi:hypothetical protein